MILSIPGAEGRWDGSKVEEILSRETFFFASDNFSVENETESVMLESVDGGSAQKPVGESVTLFAAIKALVARVALRSWRQAMRS